MSIPARWWGWAWRADNPRSGHRGPLTPAVWRRRRAGLIAHSDRGSQYASGITRPPTELHGFLCSEVKKGNCYDNAAMGKLLSIPLKGRVGPRPPLSHQGRGRADIFGISRLLQPRSGGTRPWITCHPGISRIGRLPRTGCPQRDGKITVLDHDLHESITSSRFHWTASCTASNLFPLPRIVHALPWGMRALFSSTGRQDAGMGDAYADIPKHGATSPRPWRFASTAGNVKLPENR